MAEAKSQTIATVYITGPAEDEDICGNMVVLGGPWPTTVVVGKETRKAIAYLALIPKKTEHDSVGSYHKGTIKVILVLDVNSEEVEFAEED